MNGNRLLLDTNIILYLLGGDQTLAEILEGKRPYVSFITELELYCFTKLSNAEKSKIKNVLSQCSIIDINEGIKEKTIEIRQKFNVKLPDSIIAGTSLYLDIPLISADKGFANIDIMSFLYYEK